MWAGPAGRKAASRAAGGRAADFIEASNGDGVMSKHPAVKAPALDPMTVKPRTGSGYPLPFKAVVAAREKRVTIDGKDAFVHKDGRAWGPE